MTTRSGPDAADSGRGRPDPDLDAVMGERRQLINLTYRLLGSLAEAEDAVQETTPAGTPCPHRSRTPSVSGAWLTTVASRICLNLLARPAPGGDPCGRMIPEPLPNPPVDQCRPGGTAIDLADRVASTSQSAWLSWSCSNR